MAEGGFGRARGRSRGVIALIKQHAASRSASSQSGSSGEDSPPKTSRDSSTSGRGSARQSGVLVTRPRHVAHTVGDKGREMSLVSNYFKLTHESELMVNQYHVTFDPTIESSQLRRYLLMQQKQRFGTSFLFDGMSNLKTTRILSDSDLNFSAKTESGDEYTITFKHTREVAWGDEEMIRLYNTQMRRNLAHLGYTLLGRHYYDKSSEVRIEDYGGVSIWRGYLTAIANHDGGILMACDTIYKFLRGQTALDVLRDIMKKGSVGVNFQETARKELTGCVVMTAYNSRTYRIDDITFDKTPQFVFETKKGPTTIIEYYRNQYKIDIRDLKQPLIECLPSARDKRMGRTEKILLVPELCLMTGLTDEMRANFRFVKKIDEVSRLTPARRVESLNAFISNLGKNEKVRTEMASWRLGFASGLTEINGRQLEGEKILMANDDENGGEAYEQNKGDFMRQVRGKQMRKAANLQRWIVLCTSKDNSIVDDFVNTLNRVCSPMGVKLGRPKIVTLENDRTLSYLNSLKSIPGGAEMVVCVVPNNNKERYDSIKKYCYCEKGIASQVVITRTISKKEMLMSVCTKIGIQMAVKMGAQAWALHIPPKNTMVVGYDTYKDGTLKGQSAGGFVSSLNRSLTQWYSKVLYHKNQDDMSGNFAKNMSDALKKYQEVNGALPERVIIYRDGVGDGMIPHVYDNELKRIKKSLKDIASDNAPKLIFNIVSKRVNARFFRSSGSNYDNPPPGTVIDTVITRPERYDFYLISQSVRQGTVAPTLFNIIEDETNWKPQHHQQLAYKLTHLYYNWPGTIRVPAPCQYAHKLAFLTTSSLHKEPASNLSDTLFYL